MSSCIEYWNSQGYPINTGRLLSIVAEKNRLGDVKLFPVPIIVYRNTRVKKVILRMVSRLEYIGINPLQQYTCNCSIGIKRIIILQRDPFTLMNRQLTEMVNLMNIIMILQTILSSINIF